MPPFSTYQGPMEKMKVINPHFLEGENGWHIRESCTEILSDIDRFEAKVISDWQSRITTELKEKLKQPVLVRHTNIQHFIIFDVNVWFLLLFLLRMLL